MSSFKSKKKQGFLARLRSDISGNTLPFIAAAVFPVTGMIGAGVDFSRAYLSKTRLQQACDAGALAARKYKVGSTLDANTLAKANAFFSNNFPSGAFQTYDITFTPTVNAAGEVVGTAAAKMPNTFLKIFGIQKHDINVACDAKLEIGNTDVALVLDVTGSMASSLPGGSGTRIEALRASLKTFYSTLGPGSSSEGRIRYSLVPYNTTVNVGKSLPSSALIGGSGPDTWVYQTRVANMTKRIYATSPAPLPLPNETFSTSLTVTNCAKYGNNQAFNQVLGSGVPAVSFAGGPNPTLSGGPAPATEYADSVNNNATTTADWGWSGASDTSGNARTCRRKKTRYVVLGYEQSTTTPWTYRAAPIEVSNLVSGASVNIFTGNSVPAGQYVTTPGQYNLYDLANSPGSTITSGTSSVNWRGCIEEVDTVDTITGSTSISSLPSGAFDLDMDNVPSGDATTWRPAWEDMSYYRDGVADNTSGSKVVLDDTGATYATFCPVNAARRLMEYSSISAAPTDNPSTSFNESTLTSFDAYVDSLTPEGYTIHDVGFVWGARMIANAGIFGADNPNSWNGQPVARHIIFMTDGAMNVRRRDYNSTGINELDQRVAPEGTSNTTLNTIHNRRLRIACEQAKARNITVWTIAFGEDTNSDGLINSADFPDLLGCATSANHFFTATNTTALNNAYQTIASSISELRLTN